MAMSKVVLGLLKEIEISNDCTEIGKKTALILRSMDESREAAKKERAKIDAETQKEIKEISKVVLGNGEPEKCLVVMVKHLKEDFEKRMKKSDRLNWLILATILGYVISQLLNLI
jgi:hypothetical protein